MTNDANNQKTRKGFWISLAAIFILYLITLLFSWAYNGADGTVAKDIFGTATNVSFGLMVLSIFLPVFYCDF